MPKTMEEAVEYVLKEVGEQILGELVRGETTTSVRINLHSGYGRHLRNEIGLWLPEGADLRESIWNSISEDRREDIRDHWRIWGGKNNKPYEGRDMHADDASSEILAEVITRLTQ